MATIITALVVLGFIALVIGVLIFVHNRDKKKEAEKTT
jgi:uncharacterized membrane protein HdeD (DUF308 family)